MAKSAVLQIKTAEDDGNGKIKLSIEQAKEIIKNAEIEGNTKQKEIIANAYKEKELLIQDAKSQGNIESEPFVKKGQEEIGKILHPDKDKLKNAINLVVERIVNGNGNS